MPTLARLFFMVAALFGLAGLILWKAPWLLDWFGRLPGDIRYEGDHGRVFIPITSMIVVSLLLTLLLNLGAWLLGRLR